MVELTGERPSLNGWTFVATLSHIDEIGTMIRAVPGLTVPEVYRTATRTTATTAGPSAIAAIRSSSSTRRESTSRSVVSASPTSLGHQDPHAIARYAELLDRRRWSLRERRGRKEHTGGGFRRALSVQHHRISGLRRLRDRAERLGVPRQGS